MLEIIETHEGVIVATAGRVLFEGTRDLLRKAIRAEGDAAKSRTQDRPKTELDY